MDELMKQSCKEMIELLIKVRPEIDLNSFYKKMQEHKIENEVFAQSDRTIKRYLKSKNGEGKNFDRFLHYSAGVLGIKVDVIIGAAKVWIECKGSEYEKECLDKIELHFRRLIIITKPELQSTTGYWLCLEFYKEHSDKEIEQFENLRNLCLKLSGEMRTFLSKLFSNEEEDIKDILELKKRLSNARIRVNALKLHYNKDFHVLYEIQHFYSITINRNEKFNYDAESNELLWLLGYYSALEEKSEKLSFILEYALLNPKKNSIWKL